MPPTLAAEQLGILRVTFYRWNQIGDAEISGEPNAHWTAASEQQRAICVKLVHAIAKARTKIVNECLDRLRGKAATGPWQIDAWLLERLNPDQFAIAQSVNVKHSGTVEIPIQAALKAAKKIADEDGDGEKT